MFLPVSLIVSGLCLLVWLKKPFTVASSSLLLAGIGFHGYYLWLAADYTNISGFINPNLQWASSTLQMMALMWLWSRFPSTIIKPAPLTGLISVCLLLPLLNGNAFLQHLLAFVSILGMTHFQIKVAQGQPLEQASAKIMQLTLFPLCAILCLFTLPPVMHTYPLISYWLLLLLAGSVFLGLTVAILRYRLHALDALWFQFWLWLGGAAIVILFAVLLVWPVGLFGTHAISLAIILGGFIYFPLRYWLLKKLLPHDSRPMQSFLASFSTSLSQASTPCAFGNELENALQKRFAPQVLLKQNIDVSTPELADEGLSMLVPGLEPRCAYRLSGKQEATRLFSQADAKVVMAIWNIVNTAYTASENRQQAVLEERERLLHDMHQTVGRQLEKLHDLLPHERDQQSVRNTLYTLNETVRLALPDTSMLLKDLLRDQKDEIENRTHAAGTKLFWNMVGVSLTDELTPRQAFELTQFIRETTNNALKHAFPDHLYVNFNINAGQLHIQIDNDGRIAPPVSWKPGTGTASMAARINALNGEWTVSHLKSQNCLRVAAWVPLISLSCNT